MNWLKESMTIFSTSVIKRWILVLTPICAFFMLWIGGTMDKLFGVAGYLGWLFVTGIPFLLGATFLFGSQESQKNIADAYRTDKKERFASLFVFYTIIVLVLMSVAALVGLIISLPFIPSELILVSFSSLLASTLIVSLFICPIALFLVLIFDDRRVGLGLGILLFLAIGNATGFPRVPVNFPEIAFFGPTHLHTALLFLLYGGFEYTHAVEYYVGVDFVPSQLIIPLFVFTSLTLVFYTAARATFRTRLQHWVIERELLMAREGKDGLWSDTDKKMSAETQTRLTTELANYRKKTKAQNRFAAAILISVMILIPVVGTSYVSVQREEWTTVVYEASGVTMELGVTWVYGEFRGMDHPDNIHLAVGISGEIVGGNGGYVRYNFGHRRMTLVEYFQLSESEHDAMFASGESSQSGVPGTSFGGGSWSGPINDYTYVWALRFLEVGERTTGSISISFQVIVRAM